MTVEIMATPTASKIDAQSCECTNTVYKKIFHNDRYWLAKPLYY